MSKKLIVNADDFGRTHQVSAGVLKAHLEGIVTGTTVMMNMPGAAQDLARAAAEAPKLGLGVHLVFTAGRPLLPPEWVSSLIDEHGYFLAQEAVLQDPERLDADELRAEFKSQLSTFRNATGHAPDHVDAHHFAHVHPRLFAVYHDVALEFNLPMRVPFPRSESGAPDESQSTIVPASVPQALLEAIARENRQRLADKPVRAPDRFLPGFFEQNATVDYLLGLLDRLPEGVSELMTHPGYNDETFAESGYDAQRETEVAVLTDPRVRQRIVERGIELTTFASL